MECANIKIVMGNITAQVGRRSSFASILAEKAYTLPLMTTAWNWPSDMLSVVVGIFGGTPADTIMEKPVLEWPHYDRSFFKRHRSAIFSGAKRWLGTLCRGNQDLWPAFKCIRIKFNEDDAFEHPPAFSGKSCCRVKSKSWWEDRWTSWNRLEPRRDSTTRKESTSVASLWRWIYASPGMAGGVYLRQIMKSINGPS